MKKGSRRGVPRWFILALFSFFIVGFTLIVWWEQKRGGACSEQQASHDSSDENTAPRSSGGDPIEQSRTPEETKGRPSPNPESYFCQLIAPANLPTDYLVIVGIGGVWVALASLETISRQAVSMRRQTRILRGSLKAAQDNAEAALLSGRAVLDSERAYLEADIRREGATYFLTFTNQGKTPALLIGYDVACGPFNEGHPFDPKGFGNSATTNLGILLASNVPYTPKRSYSPADLLIGNTGGQQGFCLTVRYRDILSRPNPSDSDHVTFIVFTLSPASGIIPITRISALSKYT